MLLRLLLAVAAPLLVTGACPADFDDLGLGGPLCYYFGTDNLTWTNAFVQCQSKPNGSQLLSIVDDEAYYAIAWHVVYVSQQDSWTGLINIAGDHSWADSSAYNTDIDQFLSNASSSQRYGYVSAGDGKIHLDDGLTARNYICYVDTTPPPSPSTTTTSSPTSTTPTPPLCPDGWLVTPYKGNCYLFSNNAADMLYWAQAGHGCHEQGGELVSIHDQGLITFLLLNGPQDSYWTGLMNENTTFLWEDGTTTEDVEDVLVSPGYLDDWAPGNDCVALEKAKYPQPLIHTDCFTQNNYICYQPAAGDAGYWYGGDESGLVYQ